MSFYKGMKQPLADLQLLQLQTKETASEPFLWHTYEDPKHVRGRCTTGIDDKTHKNRLFCKEGVRELRDLVGMAKKQSQTQYMVAHWQGRAQLSRTLAPQTRKERV